MQAQAQNSRNIQVVKPEVSKSSQLPLQKQATAQKKDSEQEVRSAIASSQSTDLKVYSNALKHWNLNKRTKANAV